MSDLFVISFLKCWLYLIIVMYMHDEYVINLIFMIFWMLIILIHALKWLLKCFGITKWSRDCSNFNRTTNWCRRAKTRRLATWNLSQTREQAASLLVTGFHPCLFRFSFFFLCSFSHQNNEQLLIFHSIFLYFSPMFMPKSIIQTSTHAFYFH